MHHKRLCFDWFPLGANTGSIFHQLVGRGTDLHQAGQCVVSVLAVVQILRPLSKKACANFCACFPRKVWLSVPYGFWHCCTCLQLHLLTCYNEKRPALASTPPLIKSTPLLNQLWRPWMQDRSCGDVLMIWHCSCTTQHQITSARRCVWAGAHPIPKVLEHHIKKVRIQSDSSIKSSLRPEHIHPQHTAARHVATCRPRK